MPIEQLTILAPGLLGGSVALAARAKGAAQRIVIWARRPEVRQALLQAKLADAISESPEAAVSEAQLVVIASPVDTIVPLARRVAGHIRPGAVVTDVGSVKGEIAREGHAALHGQVHFVGAHPMAGSEKTGWEHGSATLFADRTCFVTPLPETNPRAIQTVADFWRSLGARVVNVAPHDHDRIVAHISHLPQVLASSLGAFLASKDTAWRDYAGNGLRDTTRIAGSDPELWRTILQQNRTEILASLQNFQGELASFEQALARQDWDAVTSVLARGKQFRDGFR
jgi:prephenate dehydrogenase